MIGELRHKITLQIPKTKINENGFEESYFEDYKTVWSKVSNLSGKEYFEAANIQKEKTVKFLIRAGVNIDESMIIIFNDKKYNITFVDNIRYENKYIEIKGLEADDG